MYDFPPQFDSLHLIAIKLMSAFTHDWALIFNLYFLLGFPLIALSALAVFRHFGVSRAAAIAASILYAFLPSRLIKGQAHLFLDTFFEVPLAILLMLWVCGDSPPLVRDRRAESRRLGIDLQSPRSKVALLLAVIVGTTGLYYAFFSACLLIVGGAWAAVLRRSPRNFLAGLTLAAVVALTVGVQDIPTFIYRSKNGVNAEVANRLPGEAEVYGLRISQLVLPINGHRIPYLRNLESRYRASAPMPGEFLSTSLGAVASVGFLILLAIAFLGFGRQAERADLWRSLASLNLSAVLLGTVGGFGSLFALLISPQIRTYCRLNVFIAFIALFAVVLLLDRLRRSRPILVAVIAGFVLVLGLLDQTTPAHAEAYSADRARYASDGEMVARIEHAVPAGAMIFELPFRTFPESIDDYVLVRPYLHSRSLRWSYPTMRGREGETWARNTAALAPAELLTALRGAGFAGVLIDRDLYPDRGTAIAIALGTILGGHPQVSRDGNLAFFRLT